MLGNAIIGTADPRERDPRWHIPALRDGEEMPLAAGEHYRVTSVVISHDRASMSRTADRIAVLHDTRILASSGGSL